MPNENKLTVVNPVKSKDLGFDPRCRISTDFYVEYTISDDNEDDEATHVRDLTHAASFSPDDFDENESEFGWHIEIPDESFKNAIVRWMEGTEFEYSSVHHLPEATLRQLGDMFYSAAAFMRIRDLEELAEAERAARRVQTLPFDGGPDNEGDIEQAA